MRKVQYTNKALLILLAFCTVAGARMIPTAPALKDGCYSITNADELYGFAAIVNGELDVSRAAEPSACGKLENDILANDSTNYWCRYKVVKNGLGGINDTVYVCSYYSYEGELIDIDPATIEPRAQWTPLKNFSGSFDGQGHTIWQLENIEDSTQNNLGFIASVVGGTEEKPVVVRDLTINAAHINGQDTVGGVVAKNKGHLLLENVYPLIVINGRMHVAGFVGRNEGTLKIKKGAAWNVTGDKFVSAVVGSNSGTMEVDGLFRIMGSEKKHFLGAVEAVSYAGLVLGDNEQNAKLSIKNVLSDDGQVYGDSVLGGFVGFNGVGASVSIAGSLMGTYVGDRTTYSTTDRAGGLVGVNRGIVDIKNSGVTGHVSGDQSGCFVGINENLLSVVNSYSDCIANAYTNDPVVGTCRVGRLSLDHVFYKKISYGGNYACAKKYGAKTIPENEMRNGVLTIMLHNNRDGEVWGQNIDAREFYPVPNSVFGPYTYKLEFSLTLCYYDSNDGKQKCSSDPSETTYTYGVGIDQLPEYSTYGYNFMGWVYEDKPDSVITSIGKDVFGDKVILTKWEGEPVVPPQDEDGCYLVSKVGELYGIGIAPNRKCIKLVNDIVINREMNIDEVLYAPNPQRRWEPVPGYNGVFDGQGFTISGLFNQGIFSEVAQGDTLTIKNLGIVNSHTMKKPLFVKTNNGVLNIVNTYSEATSSGFVELNRGDLNVSHSHNTGKISGGEWYAPPGTIVGTNEKNVFVDHVYNAGPIFSGAGIIGINSGKAVITNSYNTGPISEEELHKSDYNAGLVGSSTGNTTIVNCYNAGPIWGLYAAGGLVGTHRKDTLTIINTYNVGPVKGERKDYGVLGVVSTYPEHSMRGDYAVYLDNVFYLMGQVDTTHQGIQAVPAVFKNGYVAKLLHDYVQKDENGNVVEGGYTGEIWGQEVGVDSFPVFKGVLVDIADSANEGDIIEPPVIVPISSSSSRGSSSSAASSSSAPLSSSDSDETVTGKSSSSMNSSSSAKSSSSDKTGFAMVHGNEVVRIEAVRLGRGALVAGIPEKSRFVLFDVQGHVVASGVSGSSGIFLNRVSAGRYYLLAGGERFSVNIHP